MNSVFISHSHKDKVIARKFAKNLKQDGLKIWIDEAELNIGDSLLSKISHVISELDYLVVIITENSIASDWVKNEVNLALKDEKFNKVKVLPLKFEECTIPDFLSDKLIGDFTTKSKYLASYYQLLDKFELNNLTTISSKEARIKFDQLTKQNPFLKDLDTIVSTIQSTDYSAIDFSIKSTNFIDLYRFLTLKIKLNSETNVYLLSRLISLFVLNFNYGKELIFDYLKTFNSFHKEQCSSAIMSLDSMQNPDYILWAHEVHIKLKNDYHYYFFISKHIKDLIANEEAIFESIRYLLIPDRGPNKGNFDSFYTLLHTLDEDTANPLVNRVVKWIREGKFDAIGVHDSNLDIDTFYRIIGRANKNFSIIANENFKRIYGFIKDNNPAHKDIALTHLYSAFSTEYTAELHEIFELLNRGRTGTEHMDENQGNLFYRLQDYYAALELNPENSYELRNQHKKAITNAYYKYRKFTF